MVGQQGMDRESYVENEFVELWIENGVVFEKFKSNTILNMTAGEAVVAERLKVSNGIVMPILVDISQLLESDGKTRKWMASAEALEFLSAGAFIIDNLLPRLAFNMFVKFDKPTIPSKAFADYDKALVWLEQFKSH